MEALLLAGNALAQRSSQKRQRHEDHLSSSSDEGNSSDVDTTDASEAEGEDSEGELSAGSHISEDDAPSDDEDDEVMIVDVHEDLLEDEGAPVGLVSLLEL
jgi:hypothetical protein